MYVSPGADYWYYIQIKIYVCEHNIIVTVYMQIVVSAVANMLVKHIIIVPKSFQYTRVTVFSITFLHSAVHN